MLDQIDARLVTLLQSDSTISNAELARQAGLSASACWRRVKALEDRGVITGYGAMVDPAAAGRGFEAIVHVRMVRHDKRQVDDFIRAVEILHDQVELPVKHADGIAQDDDLICHGRPCNSDKAFVRSMFNTFYDGTIRSEHRNRFLQQHSLLHPADRSP